ncbi:MAG: nucleoside hydrolase [Candidatus Planktophila sp.]
MKVILDTDPGIDDALALILLKAMPEISLQAITTTHGNTTVQKCTVNALKLVELLGMQNIPVAEGAHEPLVRSLSIAEETHGDTGLGYAILPTPTLKAIEGKAANLIIKIVNANPGEITILCIGPVTNLALALLIDPSLRKKIKRVVSMAGTIHHPGNATPSSEYNVFCDPEAFDILLRSGIDLTIIPLDVTYKCLFTKAHVERLSGSKAEIHDFIERSTAFYMEFHAEYQGIQGCAINDPLAAAILVNPKLVTFRDYYLDIELHGEFTTAKISADHFSATGNAPNAKVAMEVDVDGFMDFFIERVKLI